MYLKYKNERIVAVVVNHLPEAANGADGKKVYVITDFRFVPYDGKKSRAAFITEFRTDIYPVEGYYSPYKHSTMEFKQHPEKTVWLKDLQLGYLLTGYHSVKAKAYITPELYEDRITRCQMERIRKENNPDYKYYELMDAEYELISKLMNGGDKDGKTESKETV